MAKNSITDYSKTASLNTDIQSVDIDEGCLPSGINNAIRELMADLAAVNDGTVSLTSPAFAAATITGDLTVDTNTLYVDSTNNRVGIGTSSPTLDLSVDGDIWQGNGGGVELGRVFNDAGVWHIRASGNVNGLALGTNNTERLRITSSGNVGIGTSSPLARFDVESETGNVGFNYGTLSSPNRGNLWYDTDGTGWKFNIGKVQSGSFTSQITIQDNGDVGIGVTPTAKFHVGGTIQSQAGSAVAQMYADGGAAYFTSVGAYPSLFLTNGSERMRIDSSGNVGIGTSSPSTALDVAGTVTADSLFDAGAVGNKSSFISSGSYGGGFALDDGAYSGVYSQASGTEMKFYVGQNIATQTAGSAVKMTITSSGNMLVGAGATVESYANQSGVVHRANVASYVAISHANGVVSGNSYVLFTYNAGIIGAIVQSGTNAVSYNTSSDYRLKENVTGITDGIERVKQLNPSRFNFISDPEKTVDGFLAHEAQTVVPEAITGEKDAMRDEEYEVTPAILDDYGNVVTEAVMGTRSVPDYQGIDQSKLVPLLTAALQEAITKIEDLEARVATLEGN